eukprot:scaffold143258_cov21-Tisochrysis_lutea.AAC.4
MTGWWRSFYSPVVSLSSELGADASAHRTSSTNLQQFPQGMKDQSTADSLLVMLDIDIPVIGI